MKTLLHTVIASLAAFAGLAGYSTLGLSKSQAADVPRELADSGMEVLAKGPLHEGFAQPTTAAPEPGPLAPKQPPDPIPEEPPDQKPEGADVQWIPGYWSWDADKKDWLWVSGAWRDMPPDRKWVPGYWTKTDDGWRWVSGFWASTTRGELNYAEEPPAPPDSGPSVDAPDENSIYVPGVWVQRERRFLWRPGYWLGCRPEWTWSAAHYVWTPRGYVYVDGYWDYPLENRGVLFAPVCFSRPLWRAESWRYRPTFVVSIGGLFGSFWVGPGGYYFGDYYDPSYVRLGFQPWFTFGTRHYDPIFGYYGWRHRSDSGWLADLRATHTARVRGELARPPATFAGQAAASTRNAGMASPVLVAPFSQTTGAKGAKFTTLDSAQLAEHRREIKRVGELSAQRGQAETRKSSAISTFSLPSPTAATTSQPELSKEKPKEHRVIHSDTNAGSHGPSPTNGGTPTITLPASPPPTKMASPTPVHVAAPPPPARIVSPPPPPPPVHVATPPLPVHVATPPPPVRTFTPPPPPPSRGGGGHSSGFSDRHSGGGSKGGGGKSSGHDKRH
jgi:uncharacterized membrane protein YgcG